MTLGSAIARLSDADRLMMRRVQRWTPQRWLRWWMLGATWAGDGWLWVLMGAAVLASGAENRYRAFGAGTAAVVSGIALFSLLKRVVGRHRPCSIDRQCWHSLLPPDQFSFPSGHSITAFAVAVTLGSYYPSALIGLLFCALSVAASRVVLGMHFLSDVVVGCLIGSALGYLAFSLLD